MNKTLLLVDGSSYLYRAYYALPSLNHNGEPTGAILGVIKMLQKILFTYEPDYLACIFDSHNSNNLRKNIFPLYKANRSDMPIDLIKQISHIKEIVQYLGWHVIIVDEVEADDVIGTIDFMAKGLNLNVLISTGDKDLIQLISGNTILINTMKDELLNSESVIKKFGVSPNQIIDYLMLIGDKSDNIPGVNKIGPKTAVKLLNEYGSLEGILNSLEKIKRTISDNIKKSIPFFPISRALLTIKKDCNITKYIESVTQLIRKEPDYLKLKEKYEYFNFQSLLKDLNNNIKSSVVHNRSTIEDFKVTNNYKIILNWNDFHLWFDKLIKANNVSIYLNTSSSNFMTDEILGIALSIESDDTCYIPFDELHTHKTLLKKDVLNFLSIWFNDKTTRKIFYDLKYVLHIFTNENILLNGDLHDIMLQSYVLDTNSHTKLHDLSNKYLKYKILSNKEIINKRKNQTIISDDSITLWQYQAEYAYLILKIFNILNYSIISNSNLSSIYNLEIDISNILFKVERRGVKLDIDLLLSQTTNLNSKIKELEKVIYSIVGNSFNLNSPIQISHVLFEQLKFPIIKKTSNGQPSTDEDTLNELARNYHLPKLLLEYRSLHKIKSTYTEKLPRMINNTTNKVHTYYSQVAVITGRLSSSNPNLQNIPIRTEIGRNVRKAFIAENDLIMSVDYSQIELRIMSHISKDINLKNAFLNNLDVHSVTASEIFHIPLESVTSNQRRAAKAINFGLIYGMSSFGLSVALNISRNEAKEYIQSYFRHYQGIHEYMNNIKLFANEHGYVETLFGRKLFIQNINSKSITNKKSAERLAINAPIQGTAADIIKIAMIKLQEWIYDNKISSKIIMQVHDELLLDVNKSEIDMLSYHLPNIMCNLNDFKVPLKINIGIGNNWNDAH